MSLLLSLLVALPSVFKGCQVAPPPYRRSDFQVRFSLITDTCLGGFHPHRYVKVNEPASRRGYKDGGPGAFQRRAGSPPLSTATGSATAVWKWRSEVARHCSKRL